MAMLHVTALAKQRSAIQMFVELRTHDVNIEHTHIHTQKNRNSKEEGEVIIKNIVCERFIKT